MVFQWMMYYKTFRAPQAVTHSVFFQLWFFSIYVVAQGPGGMISANHEPYLIFNDSIANTTHISVTIQNRTAILLS